MPVRPTARALTDRSITMASERALSDLESPEAERRRKALLELARANDTGAIPSIQRVASGDPLPELRYLANKVLSYLTPAVTTPAPAQAGGATLEDPAPERRLEAIRAASTSGDKNAIDRATPQNLSGCGSHRRPDFW